MKSISLETMLQRMMESLREDIAPALDDAYLRTQVMALVSLLDNLSARVEEKCELLLAENLGLREVLGRVLAILRDTHPRQQALREMLEARLGEVAPAPAQENLKLQEGLVEVIEALPALELPPAEEEQIVAALRGELRRQLDGELRLRRPTRFGHLSAGI